jgi:O-antigen/teichoic acid export membrane protein
MSRTRRAIIGTVFAYLQSLLALAAGLVLLPFILHRIPTDEYGAWLAFLEIVGYAVLVDLGLLATLPWLVATAHGRGDREAIRRMAANAFRVATLTGVAYGALGISLCLAGPRIGTNIAPYWSTVRGPIFALIAATAVGYPLRTFSMILVGLQDVTFAGFFSLFQVVLGASLTVVLVGKGFGLYGLAAAVAVPPLLASIASLVRLLYIAPDLLKGWAGVEFRAAMSMTRDGIGAWLGQLGWRMAAASSSAVLAMIGPTPWVVVYACTGKTSMMLMPLIWHLSDSALVGLAQLEGEGNRQRVREVVLAMIRLAAVAAGGFALAILVVNPVFVTHWVGASKFGGIGLNAVFAASLIAYTIARVPLTVGSVLGMRTRTGLIGFFQGAVDLLAAAVLGKQFGLIGVAASGLVSSFLVALPFGYRILRKSPALASPGLFAESLLPWAVRAAPILFAGFVFGAFQTRLPILYLLIACPVIGWVYLKVMWPLCDDMPLPPPARAILTRLRVVQRNADSSTNPELSPMSLPPLAVEKECVS